MLGFILGGLGSAATAAGMGTLGAGLTAAGSMLGGGGIPGMGGPAAGGAPGAAGAASQMPFGFDISSLTKPLSQNLGTSQKEGSGGQQSPIPAAPIIQAQPVQQRPVDVASLMNVINGRARLG